MNDKHQEIADAFGRDLDPLADHEQTFKQIEADPFGLFLEEGVNGVSESTLGDYERDIRDWKALMSEKGRHPACPNEKHVREFIERQLEDNQPSYAKIRIRRLKKAFRFFVEEAAFPHSTDYNPFDSAESKIEFGKESKKEYHNVPLDDLRERVRSIKNVQDRAMVVLQLKAMLRGQELSNIKLSEINIQHPGLNETYPELGTHDRVKDRPNSVYIPPNPNTSVPVEGREGNKSKRPKVIPLDDETRQALVDYLLVRPDIDRPWLFLSQTYQKTGIAQVNRPWKEAFRPEYGETDEHRAISSHFGRHFTTDYLKQETDMAREKVQYLRGDKVGGSEFGERGAIDTYLHGHFSKVRDEYLDGIFRLGL